MIDHLLRMLRNIVEIACQLLRDEPKTTGVGIAPYTLPKDRTTCMPAAPNLGNSCKRNIYYRQRLTLSIR